MKQTIPFSKDIIFQTKIADITSISLEHEYNITDEGIKGDFIVSGTYKTHEVSINKESFLYRLPFFVELTDDIDKDSVNFEIEDFTYELVSDDDLKVNIEFNVEGNVLEKEEIQTPEVEEINEIIMPTATEERLETKDEIVEEKTEVGEEIIEDKIEDDVSSEDLKKEEKSRLDEETKQNIMATVSNSEETYITYHVHIIRENDTIESICQNYKISMEQIKQYNNIDSITIGDKIIIPEVIDE